jgi:signal transduction histidine kinase
VAPRAWIRARPWVFSPIIGANIGLLAWSGYPRARVVGVAILMGGLLLRVAVNAARAHRGDPTEEQLMHSMVVTVVLMTGVFLLAGGSASPFLYVLPGPVIAAAAAYGRSRRFFITFGLAAAGILSLLVVPDAWVGPVVAPPFHTLLVVLNLFVAIGVASGEVLALTEGLRRTDATLNTVREGILDDAVSRGRALEALGAKVAHELKNPLAAVKSLIQLEQNQANNERSQRRFEVITREVSRMESILRDYLSFSRPLEDLKLAEVDLAVVADNVIAVFEGRAAAAGVQLSRTGGSVPLLADGRRLKEALLNLVANALDATPRAGTIEVAVEPFDEGGRLIVRDTGVGMSAATVERIGTPFFTTREQGTGLGVVLARAVVTQHGGTIEFESRPGGGTTVTMTLPARADTNGGADGHRSPG